MVHKKSYCYHKEPVPKVYCNSMTHQLFTEDNIISKRSVLSHIIITKLPFLTETHLTQPARPTHLLPL